MNTQKTVLLPGKTRFLPSVLFALLSIFVVWGMISCASKPSPAHSGVPQTKEPARPLSTQDILRNIAGLCEKGDYEGALVLFDAIDAIDAETDTIRLLKASVYLSAGGYNEAGDIAGRISAASPRNTQPLLIMAAVEQARGNVKEQKVLLDRVLKI
ncbi:MAG: tetratricopeptide repeat protein [Treponema sp.]|nr:tetratricopeptide repeat protein [Treponema sp.]